MYQGLQFAFEDDSVTVQTNPSYDKANDSTFFEPVSEEDQLYQQMKDVGIRSIERDALK